MILGLLLLITGLVISAVAIYYSVIGLAAIFAAATIPIYIMGASLEVAKLVCASWLKANWSRAPLLLKTYMTTAVVVLMIITSMGIFGFLSKAHTDQGMVSGEVIERVAVIDEKIKTEKENIDVARKALKQMDESVDQLMARSNDERGAERATQIRRGQAKERTALQRDISNAQSNIARLQEERAPIAKDLRKVEAEVGPIKYIAQLIYGDNPDANILEKAVTWVTMMIVAVFDPLAVVMLLGAQMSYQWWREERNKIKAEGDSLTTESKNNIVEPATVAEPDLAEEANRLIDEIEKEVPEVIIPEEPKKEEFDSSKHPYLYAGFPHFKNIAPMVYKPEAVESKPNITVDAVVEFVPAPAQEFAVEQDYSYIDEMNKQVAEEMAVERPGDYLIMPELQEESSKKNFMVKKKGQQVIQTKK